jgi:hypothetical protein
MSVLIKGMEMPKNCFKCRFYYPTAGETNEGKICAVVMCSAANQGTSEAEYDGNRPHWCPLVHLPPHGPLIDTNERLRKRSLFDGKDYEVTVGSMLCDPMLLDKPKVIVEAER